MNQITVPFYHPDPIRVVVPERAAIYDVPVVPIPEKNEPRSEQWCQMYGIITESNLSGGIIEERDDDTYVVVSFMCRNLLA